VGDTITTCPRPSLDRRHSHDLPEAKGGKGSKGQPIYCLIRTLEPFPYAHSHDVYKQDMNPSLLIPKF
jgi:hypothetical protein